MKPTENAEKNDSSNGLKIRRIKGRRSRFYIFSITALSVFLLVAIVWPLRVREFRSTSTVEFQVEKGLALDKSNLKSSLLNALSRLTSDDGVTQAVKYVGQETTISSPLLTAMDRASIQDHLKVRLHSTNDPTKVQLSMELVGRGSQDEIELINHLTSMLVTEFSQETTRFTAALRQSEVKDQLQQLVSQVNTDHHSILSQIRSDCEHFANEVDKAIEIDQQNQINQSTAPLQNQNVQYPSVDPMKSEELKILQRQYNGIVSSPDADQQQETLQILDRRIAKLQSELGNSTTKIKNSFLASNQTTPKQKSIADHLRRIDVDDTVLTIERLTQSLEAANMREMEILNQIDTLDGFSDTERAAVILTDLQLASASQPVGGVPSMGQLFLLIVSSLMMAAATTAVFNPTTSFQPFSSSEQLREKTGLPIVAVLAPSTKKQLQSKAPVGQRLLLLFVRGCEVFLILAALLLIFSIMLKSGFVPNLIENPFHAAAKLFAG